ncbi:MAG: sugar ABC transporter permease, partial [Clostridiales bacterium]|nr:sugar ABC transporter permease [Clostridiales bacterium]
AGFEQILTFYNASVFKVGDIIDTYVFRIGIQDTKFSISAAAGMFKSIFAFLLVMTTNKLMERIDQETLF